MLTLGIDDAGRGPIIGPMILAGVLIDENASVLLKKLNVRDSKKYLNNSYRIEISKTIKQVSKRFHIVKSSPQFIDSSLEKRINLNTIEAMKTAEIINALNPKKEKIKIIVDCPSTNIHKWRNEVLGLIEHPKNIELLCEHKADVNHISVSAASILAKVAREEEVEKLKKEYEKYGKPGSGYPADPDTKVF